MRRCIPTFFALGLLAPALLSSAGVQAAPSDAPLWRVPETHLLGFRQDGLPVTRTLDTKTRNFLPSLEVREPASGKIVGTVDLPGAPAAAYPVAFTPDLQTLGWMESEELNVQTPARH